MNVGNSAGGPAAHSSVDHPPAGTSGRRPNTTRPSNQMSNVGPAMPSSSQPTRNLNFERLAQSPANLKPSPQQPNQPQPRPSQSQPPQPASTRIHTQHPQSIHAQSPAVPNTSSGGSNHQPPPPIVQPTVSSRFASGVGLPTGSNDVSRMYPSALPPPSSPNHHHHQPPQQQHSTPSGSTAPPLDPSNPSSGSPTVKKRIKLSGDQDPDPHCVALRKRILDHKYSRLKHVKDKHSEHVHELFFLQTGGNMMEYPAWKKKQPNTPQFQNFLKTYQLDAPPPVPPSSSLDSASASASAALKIASIGHQRSESGLPHGAEIKIPGVGATPVAVSTTLPAAVVQLSQQGALPGRPQGGRHGMVFGQIPVSTVSGCTPVVRLVPGGTPLVLDTLRPLDPSEQQRPMLSLNIPAFNIDSVAAASSSGTTPYPSQQSSGATASASSAASTTDQFSVKMRQEVYVMQRVNELQRDGMWTDRRLPKVQEPQRPKAHWDYLLEEMVWLAADFAQERKWKKAAAKKCSRMVQKYFQDKAQAAQRAEKAHEMQLKRIASYQSKEIKLFWANVEKLVEYKQQTKLEEKRKKALDQHLSFIVDQTEKFSAQLTEGMNKVAEGTSNASSRVPSVRGGGGQGGVSDAEFSPGNASSDDDEETIAQEERDAVGKDDVNAEIAALQKESEMDLDAFLKELPANYLKNRDELILSESKQVSADESDDEEDDGPTKPSKKKARALNDEDDDDDGEYSAKERSEDDEDTIMEQEQNENVDHQQEIDELNAENDMTIEELIEKYKGRDTRSSSKPKTRSVIQEPSSSESSSTDSENDEDDDEDALDAQSVVSSAASDKLDDDFGLNSLLEADPDNGTAYKDEKSQIINDAAAIAESIQPKGNTLSSTNVVTPVPFLLKHSLREYQHIGLDWLVTMHDRKLNGILADEMGLGKTIQTISLLAHLACVKQNWGPHLIVVPSSVMLNWEMEFKKWCPGFKILTYYGSQKERKQKRVGWTKINAFHICITSYKLVIQDHQSFRRKKWQYLILDEAQNIKNFKSQRWQLLLNFATEQRLLLTGTPLQNNLMELWSLMHFLMPNVFQSHREFKEWFSNPMTGMIEGNSEYNESIIRRLHKVLRPFLLRRLKSEVEKQMPKKYEHVVMCRLSNRQRFLYDDFMSRAKTRETLASGNLLSVINVLMQLRKVCNHPNMFEVRPTISPFRMDGLGIGTTSLVYNMLDYDPFKHIDLNSINLILLQLEQCVTAYVAHRASRLQTPKRLIEEISSDGVPTPNTDPAPRCPTGKLKLFVRFRDARVQNHICISAHNSSRVKVGTSPAIKIEDIPVTPSEKLPNRTGLTTPTVAKPALATATSISTATPVAIATATSAVNINLRKRPEPGFSKVPLAALSSSTARPVAALKPAQRNGLPAILAKTNNTSSTSAIQPDIAEALAYQLKNHSYAAIKPDPDSPLVVDSTLSEFTLANIETMRRERRVNRVQFLSRINQRRCEATPIYGEDVRDTLSSMCTQCRPASSYRLQSGASWSTVRASFCRHDLWNGLSQQFGIKSLEQRTNELLPIFSNFVIYVPAVSAPEPTLQVSHANPSRRAAEENRVEQLNVELSKRMRILHPIVSAMNTQFPDPRLIQYDCGKLQTLNRLLRQLKSGSHRVLIFTQMTRMLDILESFLNYHGHIYLRLDGTTKVEQRQVLMDRFNNDRRIFVFILSTRSGGVGVNLTGADTVIFYDSDWNPTMDAQAQDRCHRIGQTRDVHIYRLVSEMTIEENILKKANQKRMLGQLAIEGGNFTTDFFKSSTIQDLFKVDKSAGDRERESDIKMDVDEPSNASVPTASASTKTPVSASGEPNYAPGELESALAAAEDEQDVQAAKIASAEAVAELDEFDETIPIEESEARAAAAQAANAGPELSRAEQEVENLVKQLNPIERYAMRFVEETGGLWTAEQLRAAEAEIEQQKREWEANRLATLQKEQEDEQMRQEEDEMLTYSRADAKNQIWISDNSTETMPMWCPPTPPQDNDEDIYIDHSLGFMYEQTIMPEASLPPVYIKKDYKRTRTDAGFHLHDSRRHPQKIRKEDNYYPPRSMFDRPSPAQAKLRRELKIQRYRGCFNKANSSALAAAAVALKSSQVPPKPLAEPEGMGEWFIYEDIVILNVVQQLQGLPLNLMLLSPGHIPNWDFVADIVNQSSRMYRTPKQCRYRYEMVIVPREEGKLVESPSPKKSHKANPNLKNPKPGCPNTPGATIANKNTARTSMKASQLFATDNNASFTKLMRVKFESIKTASQKKSPQLKQVLVNPSMRNPKHAAVLGDFGITDYENPPTPLDIAVRRVEKIKEKQRAVPTQGSVSSVSSLHIADVPPQQTPPPPQQQQQQQQPAAVHQHHHNYPINSNTNTPTSIIVQQPHQVQVQNMQPITAIVSQQPVRSQLNIQQQTKLMATTQTLVAAGSFPQIQQSIQPNTPTISQAPVSVVLSSSLSGITTTNLQHIQQPQIVSIHQPSHPVSSTIQTMSNPIIQTIQPSIGQLVSVGQLLPGGTASNVLTTNCLPTNASVATLSAAPGAIRTQRLLQSGQFQEVVLHRPGSQSPTVVSVSGLSSGHVSQPTQLRLSVGAGGVTKAIPIGQAGNKQGANTTQSLFFRPQLRQQLKVIHPGGQAVAGQSNLIASGANATLIQPGSIVQTVGGTVHSIGGQKVSIATSSDLAPAGSILPTNVLTAGQAKTQFVKQIAGKQTITARQGSDGEMLLVKRQIIGQPQPGNSSQTQPKGQILTQQQAQQMFAASPGGIQLQQTSGVSGQTQHVATLVKTSSTGGIATGTSVGMISQIKSGTIKTGTLANQNQMRQLQLHHQQMTLAQQRKTAATVGKMAQITQISGGQNKVGGSSGSVSGIVSATGSAGQLQQPSNMAATQLIVQAPKGPNTVTVQQIQQAFRQQNVQQQQQSGQTVVGGTTTTGQIVLAKPGIGVSRVIPVSVSTQQNPRQIQVVSASNALTSAGASIRAHVTNSNISGQTIKTVTSSIGQQQQAPHQQAIFSAIQAHQAQQRQNASPVRIQTSAGNSLLALTVHQTSAASPHGTIVTSQQQHQQNVIIDGQQQQSTTSTAGGTASGIGSGSGSGGVGPSGGQQQQPPPKL